MIEIFPVEHNNNIYNFSESTHSINTSLKIIVLEEVYVPSVYLIFTEWKCAQLVRTIETRAEADVKMDNACSMNRTDSALSS